MKTRLVQRSVALASAALATGLATADVVSSARDNADITVSDNYRTVFNTGVTFSADPAAEKDGKADISWIIMGGTKPASAGAAGTYPTDGVTVPVDVPKDVELTVGRLDGGRAKAGSTHKFVKTGKGVMALGEARCFGGTVQLDAGTLAAAKRAIPTSLPDGAIVHFDFSQESTVTKDEDGHVSSVANLGSASCTLVQSTAALQPTFVRDLPSQGLNGLDFGPDPNAGYLSFTPAQTLVTVLVVVDSRIYTPKHFMDGSFRCLYDWVGCHYSWKADAYARFKSATAVWVNGLPIDVTKEFYESPGFNIVVLQAPANTVKYLGALWTNNYGGMRIFEVVGYDRALNDREARDASAFLSKKWLNRTTPGYADMSGVADLQAVVAAGGTTLDVAGGTTEKVTSLTLDGPVAKTGAGALAVVKGTGLDRYLTVRGGNIGAAGVSDVASNCEIAKLPTLHLDASRTDLVKTFANGGTNFVWCWQDASGFISVQKCPVNGDWGVNYSYPWFNTDANARCNGLPVIDFGPCAPGWSSSTGASIPLSRSLQNVRAVYFVLGSQAGGGTVLGCGPDGLDSFLNGARKDFFRGTASSVADAAKLPLFNNATCCAAVCDGEIFINGDKKDHVWDYVPNGGYELVELHTTAGCTFSNIGNGYDAYVHGGFRLGEIIVFERPLTDRERVATRNYLLKKWFAKTDAELDPLPAKPEVGTLAVRAIAPDVSASIGGDVETALLSGTGTVETASHTLTVCDISDFTGTVKVSGGLVLSGKLPVADPELVTDGRILHLDACEGVTAVTNGDGSVSVRSWASRLDDGLVALPGPALQDIATTNYPSYLASAVNEKPVVSMGSSGQQHFLFCKNGLTNRLENIQSVFWVVGSQEGGGFLLGGGAHGSADTATTGEPYVSGFAWHRGGGGTAGSAAADSLVNGNAHDAVRNGASWRLNGESVVATSTGLSGNYDVVSFVMRNGATAPDADGLAFDGRYLGNLKDYGGRVGRQRLAELIVYNRRLSAVEVTKVEAYLQAKWGFAQQSPVNAAQVEVAAGATVSCPTPQYLGKLYGAGSVSGDVTVKGFVVDAAVGALTVSGTLTIPENPVVEVRDFGSADEVVIAEATSYEGVANLKNATVIGEPSDIRIRISGGRLVAKRRGGMLLIVR